MKKVTLPQMDLGSNFSINFAKYFDGLNNHINAILATHSFKEGICENCGMIQPKPFDPLVSLNQDEKGSLKCLKITVLTCDQYKIKDILE